MAAAFCIALGSLEIRKNKSGIWIERERERKREIAGRVDSK